MKGHISWSYCNEEVVEGSFYERVKQSAPSKAQVVFELNVRVTAALYGVGLGYEAMNNWCAMMNLSQCLNKLAYENLQ